MNLYSYEIKTKSEFEMINIDNFLKDSLDKSKVKNGLALIYCPHTTAGITINENSDPHVLEDLKYAFNILSPKRDGYLHFEGNTNAHLLASLIGASETIIIHNESLTLGRWQSLYFCEFDGPRTRQLYIKISSDK